MEFLTAVLAHDRREPNFWDGALILPSNKYALILPLVLGFVLVVGDLYVRDLSGTAPLTLLRSRYRVAWWAGKLFSLAPAALLYSALAYLGALAGSALRLPLSWRWSGAASVPWGREQALYPRFEGAPAPVFFLFVVAYTGLALWAVGSLVLAASALYPRMLTPLAAGLVLVFAGSKLEEPLTYQPGAALLNPVYHVTYVSEFGGGGVPWAYAAAVLGGALLISLAVGVAVTRRADV